MAVADMNAELWARKWQEQCDLIGEDIPYQESAEQLRKMLKTGLLKCSDLETNPEKFFLAHRMLVGLRGPGFWIRFTVLMNLYGGSVVGLGSPEQVKELEECEKRGLLGCFGLTEKFAGVNSGLVVQTTATWDKQRQGFVLHSPTEGSHKNWISQGLTAEKAVVIACLILEGKNLGPHGFWVDMRDEASKKLMPGITVGDMGRKSTGNDLDNAWIAFDKVFLPRKALLSRFCEMRGDEYVQTTKERMRIEVIGQRLLTGRVAVAQAASTFCSNLFTSTKEYTSTKKCWAPGGEITLGEIPHLKALMRKAEVELGHMQAYLLKVEGALNDTLRKGGIPSPDLVQAIAVGKIAAVGQAIALCFKLKQEVGSFALMGGTGFEHLDFLQCCAFAEGDGRILSQKLARDQVRLYGQKQPMTGDEAKLCEVLSKGGKDQWDENYETVYQLAETIQRRVIRDWTGKDVPIARV